jgi:hypothetical protein
MRALAKGRVRAVGRDRPRNRPVRNRFRERVLSLLSDARRLLSEGENELVRHGGRLPADRVRHDRRGNTVSFGRMVGPIA